MAAPIAPKLVMEFGIPNSSSLRLQLNPRRQMAISAAAAADGNSLRKTSSGKVVLGCGTVVVDYLASVASFPQPDDKIRTTDFQYQGGGNVGNALTGASRLGLKPIIISKVADDPLGERILNELQNDGVDTSQILVAKGGVSPFTYVIIDRETRTRTCIHTPGYPVMVPAELDLAATADILERTELVFFDGRLGDTALEIAKMASERGIPILMDAEKKRDYLDELLIYTDYLVASAGFPKEWTGASTLADALYILASKLPRLRFVIVTLGERGSLMLERYHAGDANPEEAVDVNATLESLSARAERLDSDHPCVVSSKVGKLVPSPSLDNAETEVLGRLIFATSQKVPLEKLVDTTGAGDAFIGAVMYCLCSGCTAETMLTFAASVAAANCQEIGARAGLPKKDDPRLAFCAVNSRVN